MQQGMLICGGICLVIIIAIVAIVVASRRGQGGGGSGPQLDIDGDDRVSDTEWAVYKSRRDSEEPR